MTVTSWTPVLLAATGSASVADTLAVLLVVPIRVGETTTETERVWPLRIVPSGIGQVSPATGVRMDPSGEVAEMNVAPAGRTSVRMTLVASLGPLFVTGGIV